jgi:hypothetical protein
LIINNFEKVIYFEHGFWLQVLGDHSRFLLDSFSSSEKDEIREAKYFINLFDTLLEESRKDLPGEKLISLTEAAYKAANEILNFKLHIIREQLVGNIKIKLPPTFINHMVNEVQEYILVLNSLLRNQLPIAHTIHHHLLWLPDGAGHAFAIGSSLDSVEKDLIAISKDFSKTFDNMFIKATEFVGYMRTCLTEFPALNRLNSQAEIKMTSFQCFLKELEELVKAKKALGTLTPLMLDHMYREECYYLTKLSQVSEVNPPECDPTKPRVQS